MGSTWSLPLASAATFWVDDTLLLLLFYDSFWSEDSSEVSVAIGYYSSLGPLASLNWLLNDCCSHIESFRPDSEADRLFLMGLLAATALPLELSITYDDDLLY